MDFRDFLVVLKRRKWIFLGIVAIVLSGYLWTVAVEVQIYSASAHLYVAKSSVRSLVGERIQLSSPGGMALQTQVTLLTSPAVFERAARAASRAPDDPAGAAPRDANRLRETVSLRFDERAQALYVLGTGENRREVLGAVRAVAEAIREYAREIAQREYVEADAALQRESATNEREIAAAQEGLEALRRAFHETTGFEIGFGGFERESDRLLREIERREGRLKEIRSARAVLESKIDLLARAGEGEETDLSRVSLAIDLSPSLDDLRRRIVDARARLARLQEAFTDRHPDVAATQAEVRDLAGQLERALQERQADFDAEETVTRRLLEETKASMASLASFRAEFMRRQRTLEILQETQSWLARTLAELRLGKSFQTGSVHVVSLPEEAEPHLSRTRQAWPFVVAMAFALAAVIAYLSDYLDDTIQTDYQVSRYLNVDVVGHFPYVDEEEKRFIGGLTPSHPIVEVFNRTAARVLAIARSSGDAQVILVASPSPDDGKTTVAANLAVAFALLGQKTVLVDADLRKPRMHQLLDLRNDAGLSTYLTGRLEARQILEQLARGAETGEAAEAEEGAEEAARARARLLRETSIPHLRAVTAGPVTTNPMQCLESARFASFLEHLRGTADRIVIDSPPLSVAADGARLAARADAILLVLVAGRTQRHEASWAKHFLAETGTPVFGVVLNKVRPGAGGYSYYYYYGYDQRELRERA